MIVRINNALALPKVARALQQAHPDLPQVTVSNGNLLYTGEHAMLLQAATLVKANPALINFQA